MLEQIKAVIFDLDGTLVDSMWMWRSIDMEYLASKGIEVPENLEAFQEELEGMGFTETAMLFKERFGIPDSLEEIKETWIRMSGEKYQKEVPLKPGAKWFLGYLKEKGIKVGISSSNSRELIQMVLEAMAFWNILTVLLPARSKKRETGAGCLFKNSLWTGRRTKSLSCFRRCSHGNSGREAGGHEGLRH